MAVYLAYMGLTTLFIGNRSHRGYLSMSRRNGFLKIVSEFEGIKDFI